MGLKVCPYCGYTLDESEFTIDHLIPQSFCKQYLGGSDVKDSYYNRVEVCFSCNRDKSNDIWIPDYSTTGWMRNLNKDFIEGHSRLFFEVLKVRKDEMKWWIYAKNVLSHTDKMIRYPVAEVAIDKDLANFLTRFIWKCKYKDWELRSQY